MLLAATFVWAAAAKLNDRKATTADFTSLGLIWPRMMATVVPVVEIAIAVLLVTWPGWGGVAAFALLVMFTTILVPVIRSGRIVSCACFGGSSSRPVTKRSLMRNGALIALALAATTVGRSTLSLLA